MSELEDVIESALNGIFERGEDITSHDAAVTIAQALRSTDPQCVVAKELEWEGDGHWYCGDNEGWLEEANTSFGWGYSIEFGSSGNFKADSTFGWSQDGFDTPDKAKTACQADFERRILSSISLRSEAEVKAEGAREALEKAAQAAADLDVYRSGIPTRRGERAAPEHVAELPDWLREQVRSQSSEGEV